MSTQSANAFSSKFYFLHLILDSGVGPADVHDLQNPGKGFFMNAFIYGRSYIYEIPGNDRVIP